MKDSDKENRPDWKTLIVSFICLLGALAGGVFLFFDLNRSGESGFGKPLGKVERRESKVRRKSASSYVWTNVQTNENLFRKDSIQTGRSSAAAVRLADGSLLDIGEDSLVVMDDTTNLSLNFLRGSVVVHKAEGDSKISVGKDGKARVEELSAKLIKPESLAQFFVAGKNVKQIAFTWEPRSKTIVDPYTLQVSEDKRFSPQFTKNFTTKDSNVKIVRADLTPGTYYWRVLSKLKVLTETRQFRVMSVAPLQLVFPANHQSIASSTIDSSAQFRWVNPKSSGLEEVDVSQGDHRIEVARDAEFKKPVSSQTINPTNGVATIQAIPLGFLFWRIKSTYGDFTTISPVMIFDFHTFQEPTSTPSLVPVLSFPNVVKPSLGDVIKILDAKSPIEASWSEVEGAAAYEVTVNLEPKGGVQRKEVLRVTTDKTQLSLKDLGPGDYSWTIRAMDKEKLPGTPMPLIRFTLTYGDLLAPPEIVSPEVQ